MVPYRSQSIVVATRHIHKRQIFAPVFFALCIFANSADRAKADAGGVGFWLPGLFGSLAAVPTVPGWAYSTIYLHRLRPSVSAILLRPFSVSFQDVLSASLSAAT
jgi:hypothetical protein